MEGEEQLLELARSLVEEVSAAKALELAALPPSTENSPLPPPTAPPLPPRTGAGAVHPHLGHHLVREHPHDTISRIAYRSTPRPYEVPPGPDQKTLQLQQAKEELGKYGEWADKVKQYQSASKEVEQHASQQAAQGVPLPGTYKAWTPDEHASHHRYAQDAVARALKGGRATSNEHTLDGNQVWSPERAAMHTDLAHEALDKATDVPSSRQGMLVGGFRHPGRETMVGKLAPDQYVHADPELVKDTMAALGLIPEIKGLSPAEGSALVHQEAVHIAHLIADLAMHRGKNLAVHMPMASSDAVQAHAGRLRDAGYSVHGAFMHTPVDKAVDQGLRAHRSGHEQYRAGKGPGAKLPLPGALAAAETSGGSSANQDTFVASQPHMDSWEHWDNSEKPHRTDSSGATSDVTGGIPSVEELRRRVRGHQEPGPGGL